MLLVLVKSRENKDSKLEESLVGGFFSAIQEFNSAIFSQRIELLIGNTDCVVFSFQNLALESFQEQNPPFALNKVKELLLGYAVVPKNGQKNIEKHCRRKVIPILNRVLLRFKYTYIGRNFNNIDQFKPFQEVLIQEFKVR